MEAKMTREEKNARRQERRRAKRLEKRVQQIADASRKSLRLVKMEEDGSSLQRGLERAKRLLEQYARKFPGRVREAPIDSIVLRVSKTYKLGPQCQQSVILTLLDHQALLFDEELSQEDPMKERALGIIH